MKFLRSRTVLAIAAVIAFTAIALYWLCARRGIASDRVYRIGWESDPPFQAALENGEPSGLSIELVREAARRRHIRLEWVRRQRAGQAALVNKEVDLWPLMTIIPERRELYHISEAYLEHGFFFLVGQDSPYRRPEDLEQRTISHLNQQIVTYLMKQYYPRARRIPSPTTRDAVEEVCTGHADAGLFEENGVLSVLLDGVPCAEHPFRLIWVPFIRTYLGVAATFETAAVADEIREEIGVLSKEGRLPAMASRWGDFSVRNTETIHSLQDARQREGILIGAIIVFACLFVLAMLQTIRRSREANRARRAEQTLRHTEQRLRFMANSLSEIVLAYGMDRELVFANPAVEHLTGYPVAELEDRGFCFWLHPDDESRISECWDGLFTGGGFHNEEFRLIARNGGIRWMVANCGPILDDTGRQVGVQGSLQDVTESKLAGEALRLSEERFRLIADTLPSLVWTARPDGLMDYVNRVFRDYTGIHRGTSACTADIVHPDDLKTTGEHWQLAMQTATPYRVEHRLRRYDGVFRWHLSCGVPALSSDGHALQWCGTSTDIHELKLRESEERFRHIADTAPVIVWITGPDTLQTFFNRQAAAFTGCKVEDLLGHAWIELAHPDDRDSVMPAYMAALKDGRDFQLEFRLRRADQTYRWMLSTGIARWENGACVGHVGTILDITDLKRNQEEIIATQKLEGLGVMAAGIAHDFNNLLGSILLDSESILSEPGIGAAVRETAQRIEAVALRASEIVRQLLAFAGRGAAIHEPVNVSRLIGETLDLLKVSISKRAILKTELTREPLTVRGNAAQIQQVIMNLVTNASEALGDGEGFVTVRTSRVVVNGQAPLIGAPALPQGEYARVEVIDTGCGMTEEVKNRIFEPFFTTKFSGRGLGLSAVQGIIRGHGGVLRVETAPGQGSRFEVLFPGAETPAHEAIPVLVSGREPVAGTALIVEDEDCLRIAVSKSLRRKGFSIIEAGNGHTAIHLFKTHPEIDIVLLDMTLPGMSGIEILAELKAIRSDTKVILTTAYSREMAMSTMGDHRISDFIRKPYLVSDLLITMQKVMSATVQSTSPYS